ncbi:rod shape-determining protein MreC [Streptomyces aidingensis]|uniref:Cell shape-determining protein MreC n=1 Tax=Streptomyces aidingensis TaxID=910347 RepID=A0A1I1FPQ1_9ACTN|nr:rod shape-determining protein MreC [Streptomyces aidingensis]SFB99063.1 rod shape-determining protein MreC [Streptomyces aidingensis]
MRDSRESRLLLILLVSIAFALITVDIREGDNSPLNGPREAAAAVFGPVESGAATVVDPVANAIGAVRDSGSRQDRISALEQENAELRQQLGNQDHQDSRVEQLDDLLRTAGAGQYSIVGAQVIAIGPAQGFSWTITIDAGTRDGIDRDMTVINGDGLVGRVTTVGPGTATVLLASDPRFTVGTRMEGSNELGFATGRGDNALDVQLLNHRAEVKKGDRLVTFGSAGNKPFVPGVPVGEVTSVEAPSGDLTRTVRVRPFVAFTQLDLVGVVVEPPRADPRDAVLPEKPREPEPGTQTGGSSEVTRPEDAGEPGAPGEEEAADQPQPDTEADADADPDTDAGADAGAADPETGNDADGPGAD